MQRWRAEANKWTKIPNIEKPSIKVNGGGNGLLMWLEIIAETAIAIVAPETLAIQGTIAAAGVGTRAVINPDQGLGAFAIDALLSFAPLATINKAASSVNKLNKLSELEKKSIFPKLTMLEAKQLLRDNSTRKAFERYFKVRESEIIEGKTFKSFLRQKQVKAIQTNGRRSMNTARAGRYIKSTGKWSSRPVIANTKFSNAFNKTVKQLSKEMEIRPNVAATVLAREYKVPISKLTSRGKLTTIDSQVLHNWVQIVHMLDAKLAARKIITKGFKQVHKKIGLTQHGFLGIATRQLEEKFSMARFLKVWNLAEYEGLRPTASKMGYTMAYRAEPMDVEGHFFTLVIYYNPLNTRCTSNRWKGKQPKILTAISRSQLDEFVLFTGAYDIDHWSMTRGGRRAVLFDNELDTILGKFIRYGVLQDTLSLVSHLKKDIKHMAEGDYFSSWGNDFIQTTKRLTPHKLGKMALGRYGIAAARGFQSGKDDNELFKKKFKWNALEEAGFTGFRKYLRRYEGRYQRQRRREIRWAKNFHRTIGVFDFS